MTKVFGTFSVTKHSPTYFTFNDTSNPGWHHYLDITEDNFNTLSNIFPSVLDPDNIYFHFGTHTGLFRVKPAGGLEFIPPQPLAACVPGNLTFDNSIIYVDGEMGNYTYQIKDNHLKPKPHVHIWKEYVGFTHRYYYCDCNEKRDTLP